MKGVWLETLTWPEAKARIDAGAPVIIPIGAVSKEHGHHLPLNTDFLTARELANRVAAEGHDVGLKVQEVAGNLKGATIEDEVRGAGTEVVGSANADGASGEGGGTGVGAGSGEDGRPVAFVDEAHALELVGPPGIEVSLDANLIASGRVAITSQNHGFAVDPDSLPASLRVTHVSLFDQSLQGLERIDRPAFCFQGHPEASPGPQDIGYLFDRFVALMR